MFLLLTVCTLLCFVAALACGLCGFYLGERVARWLTAFCEPEPNGCPNCKHSSDCTSAFAGDLPGYCAYWEGEQ